MKQTGIILGLALVLLMALGCGSQSNGQSPAQAPAPDAPSAVKSVPAQASGETVLVELWVMSECPFGTGAENSLKKVDDVLSANIDLSIRFIVDRAGDGFGSLHGEGEVKNDLIQLCAGIADPSNQLGFIVEFNNTDKTWEQAAKQTGYDPATIATCMKNEGLVKLGKDADEGKQRGIASSPTLIIAGKEYEGSRGSLDIFDAVCGRFAKDNRPAVCDTPPDNLSRTDATGGTSKCGGNKPAPVPPELVDKSSFTHTVIVDDKGFSSNEDLVIEQTQQYFPNMKIKKVAASSSEGKKLIAQHEIAWLPAYLFPDSITETKNYSQLRQVLRKTTDGSAYMLSPAQVGANVALTRERKKGDLKIYYSPFSQGALTMLLEIFDLMDKPEYSKFSSGIAFIPSIAVDGRGELQPRGGMAEIEEAGRHLAVLGSFPDKFRIYVAARHESPNSSYWEEFAVTAGIDPAQLKSQALSDAVMNSLVTLSKEGGEVHAVGGFAVLVENREVVRADTKQKFTELLKKVYLGK
jgi:hypothetical protein